MTDRLYKFNFDCGRMGNLDGIFVADDKKIKQLIKQNPSIYFGEVLGKYSEIFGDFSEMNVEKIKMDSRTVKKVSSILGKSWGGYNLMDYVKESELDNQNRGD